MRIAHVIDYFHEDVGYQEYYLARFQAEAGHDVRVVSSTHRHSSLRNEGATRLDISALDVVRIPARQLGHDRAWLHGLPSALDEYAPDAVHVHGAFAPTTVRVARWCQRTGTHLLVDNHLRAELTPSSSGLGGRAYYLAYRVAFGRLLRCAVGSWVPVGPDEERFLLDRLSLPPERVDCIPHGFDPAAFNFDAARRARVRSAEGWGDEVVVTMTGKLYAEKRPDLVAAACERRGGDIRLVLAGTIAPEVLTATRAAAPTLDAAGRVEVRPMLGRDALADLFVAADVAVFPLLPSISIQEAAGTGARVVMGDGAYARWLHERCSVIEAVDLARLADALEPVADREVAAATARGALSWPMISDEFVRAYGTPLSAKAGR